MRRGSRRGYSLIEAVLAGVIFATGLAAILSATSTYMGIVEHDRKLGEAWRLLQGQAALLRGLPDSAAEWAGSTTVVLDRFGVTGTGFTIERIVTPNTPFPPVRQVELRATWQESTRTRTTSLVIHR